MKHLACVLLAALAVLPAFAQERIEVPLDPAGWTAAPADGVALELSEGAEGALRLEYDFQGRGGWAAARRSMPLDLPETYEIRFRLRGEGPTNDLELKLADASGENVWWHVKRELRWPAEWTPMRVRSRQVELAWGPLGSEGGEVPPRDLAAIELTVTAGAGGAGWVEVAGLEIVPTEPLAPPEGPPSLTATGSLPRRAPSAAMDGDPVTAWEPAGYPAQLSVDLRGRVLLGGLSLLWQPERAPERFRVEVSEDGESWGTTREVAGGAIESHLRLPDAEAARLRVSLDEGACPEGCALAELTVRPPAFGASMNGFLTALGEEAPRGAWPRGFSGEAAYWTVVGVDRAPEEALVSEDGAVEVGEKGFSIEPFVRLAVPDGGAKLFTWADVAAERSLADGVLPIPTVAWPLPGLRLEITALADGPVEASSLRLRYRVVNEGNEGAEPLAGTLYLAIRPLQVNPPYQFLNVSGGHAPVSRIACESAGARVTQRTATGEPDRDGVAVVTAPAPDACGAQAFARGRVVEPLIAGRVPDARSAEDPDDLASGALGWDFELAAGEATEVVAVVPLADGADATPGDFDAAEAAAREEWREALGPMALDLPESAQPLVDTLRSSLAYILVHRDGPAIQPGSRAYARSWIRDGALTGAALLRLGRADVAKDFAEWFAPFQYESGKVPCCVDRRGAGPVDEHDSHGELIHLVREVYRHTGDQGFAERMMPHVAAAVDFLETLRQSRRTAEYESGERRAFYGLLPESISHEGYSAKPVHSYWDDAFGYRGLADATALAEALGRDELAAEWAARRDQFRDDFLASIQRVRERRGLAYVPASADLGDFDPTSTTILLDPAGLWPWLEELPGDPLEATFERYWREIQERWPGGPDDHQAATDWDAYTPYEIRHVGAFVRLGWKERAHELLAHFLADRRPTEWNQWPEVVTRDPRRVQFLGDLPHGWVASDFVRSFLDLFAYEDREAERLVLGAGVPAAWLERPEGIGVRRLATPWGELSYRLERRPDGGVRYRIEELSGGPPPGGVALEYPLAGSTEGEDGAGEPTVDGEPVEVEDGRVILRALPATVEWPAASPPGSADPNRVDIIIRTESGNEGQSE